MFYLGYNKDKNDNKKNNNKNKNKRYPKTNIRNKKG